MRQLLAPLAGVVLLTGFGAASATEPTTNTSATEPTTLNAAALDNITAGWSQSSNPGREERTQGKGGERTNQSNNSFLSPQVNLAALNNISVLSFGTYQSLGQSNANGNFISH